MLKYENKKWYEFIIIYWEGLDYFVFMRFLKCCFLGFKIKELNDCCSIVYVVYICLMFCYYFIVILIFCLVNLIICLFIYLLIYLIYWVKILVYE